MKSYAKKMFLPAFVSAALLFTGCGSDTETDEAKQNEVEIAINEGDFDKAIAMLEKDCAGFAYDDCQLNLGAAYFGKAGFDGLTIAREITIIDGNTSLTAAEKEIQTTAVIFDKLFDPTLSTGIAAYKNVLPGNDGSLCNYNDYTTVLTQVQKDACLAINPILLGEITSGTATSTGTVDLQTIVEFKSIIDSAIPGLTTEEFVSVISGGTLPVEKDINGNGSSDELEITECAIQIINGAPPCSNPDITWISDETDVTIGGVDFNVTRMVMSGAATASPDKNFARLWTQGTLSNSTVTILDTNITDDGSATPGVACDDASISGCYPEPDLTDGVETFDGVVVAIINNDVLLESLTTVSEDQNVTFDICYPDGITNVCDVDPDTGTQDYISQDVLLDYLSTTK